MLQPLLAINFFEKIFMHICNKYAWTVIHKTLILTITLKHLKYRVLFCSSLLGERINPTGYCPIDRGSENLRFNVLIREDAKGSPFTDVNAKAALSSHYFKTLSRGLTRA